MSEELKVYIKPGCPWCIAVVAHLQNEGYHFNEIDVIASDKAYEEMKRLSRQSLTPTLTYGDQLLADCGVAELKTFLAENNINP